MATITEFSQVEVFLGALVYGNMTPNVAEAIHVGLRGIQGAESSGPGEYGMACRYEDTNEDVLHAEILLMLGGLGFENMFQVLISRHWRFRVTIEQISHEELVNLRDQVRALMGVNYVSSSMAGDGLSIELLVPLSDELYQQIIWILSPESC